MLLRQGALFSNMKKNIIGILIIAIIVLIVFTVHLPFIDYVTYSKPGTDGNLISHPTLFQYIKYH